MTNEWIVEFTDEFELWWLELSELVQEKCAAVVDLLTREGPNLGFPYSSSIRGGGTCIAGIAYPMWRASVSDPLRI